MDFEKMQSTMQFLLQQQAKHDLMIAQLQNQMKELQKSRIILTALAQKQRKRLDSDNNRQSPPSG